MKNDVGARIFLCNRIQKSEGLLHNIYKQMEQKKESRFHCAKHFDKPLKARIVFSKGFHDS